jgi:hypothetical protein
MVALLKRIDEAIKDEIVLEPTANVAGVISRLRSGKSPGAVSTSAAIIIPAKTRKTTRL